MDNPNSYRALEIKLDAPADKQEIVKIGREVAAITVNSLPVAAVGKVRLHFGSEGDGLRLRHESLPIIRSPAWTGGVYLTIDSPGFPGEVLELWIGVMVGEAS